MKKHERESKQEQAFELYIKGSSMQRIANLMKTSRNTIINWESMYQWKERKARVDQEVEQRLNRNLVNMRIENVYILKSALDRFAQSLAENSVKVSASDAARIVQLLEDIKKGMPNVSETSEEIRTLDGKRELEKLLKITRDGLGNPDSN